MTAAIATQPTRKELAQALFDAVTAGDRAGAMEWLAAGAPMDIKFNGRAAIHQAVLRRDMLMLRLLIDAGSPLDIKTDADALSPVAIAAQKLKSGAFVEELLAAGASPFLQGGIHGQTPRQMVASLGQPPVGMMHQIKRYEQTPLPVLDAITSRAQLEQDNAVGRSLADHPLIWRKMSAVNAQLQKVGEAALDKDWILSGHPRHPSTRLGEMLRHAREYGSADRILAGALHAMEEVGTPLELSDLLGQDGAPTELLKDIVTSGAASALFSEEMWIGRSVRELKTLHHAVEAISPVAIDNFHGLAARVAQSERQRGREAAR